MELHATAKVAEKLLNSGLLTKEEVKRVGAELVRRYSAMGSIEVTHIKNSFAFITRTNK